MLRWQIGNVTVSRLVELETPIAPAFLTGATPEALAKHAWLYPRFVTSRGNLRMSVHAFLVEWGGGRLVVDTCIGNDRPRALIGGTALATPFLHDLERAGWTRDSVTTVVCTHLHVDHVGWNTMLVDATWVPTFPNARYLIGRRELAHWKTDTDPEQRTILDDSVAPVVDVGLVDLVEMEHRIDEEIRLVPTPGHTPGHVSVMIESAGSRAVITGDMTHHPSQLAHPEWSSATDTDPRASEAMRRERFAQWADERVLVLGTHYAPPTAGYIVRDGPSFRFEAVAASV